MRPCSVCGAPSLLLVGDVPFCLKCAGEHAAREAAKQHQDNDVSDGKKCDPNDPSPAS